MKHLLRLALEWAIRSFGDDQMRNLPLRSLRVVEEAIELAQACGVPKETVALCVDKVYERPTGEIAQEIGGVLMTIYLFVAARARPDHLGRIGQESPDEYFVDELARVLAKSPEHFAKRNAEKLSLGLTARGEYDL